MRSRPVDEFVLAYERTGDGPPVLLLHGWPGDRSDYHDLLPQLIDSAEVLLCDLRGFGESDKHRADPAAQYDAAAQARSVAGLLDELGWTGVVVAGYDVGSRVAQALARSRPDLVRALVLGPPMPGAGTRVRENQAEYWYQAFHQLSLVEELVDGRPDAVRAYLRHFWNHWSGPDFEPSARRLDHLQSVYSGPGSFAASISWYRAGAGTVAVSAAETAPDPGERLSAPITVLWPEHDPLFPRAWSDRLEQFFADVHLHLVDGVGHFLPVEAPAVLAEEIIAALRT